MKFSSLAALEVIILTTFRAGSDQTFVKITFSVSVVAMLKLCSMSPVSQGLSGFRESRKWREMSRVCRKIYQCVRRSSDVAQLICDVPNIDHYNDVIMGAIASQVTSLTIVYSTVYSDADQRKHQSSVSLAFVRGIHRGPVNSPHKWPVTRKMFPLDDVILFYSLRLAEPAMSLWHGYVIKST